MSLNWATPGHNHVSEYQQSGVPFVTSSLASTSTSPIKVEFPYVTKFVNVIHNGASGTTVKVGFTENGVNGVGGNHFFTLTPGTQTGNMEVKCTELWILSSASTATWSLVAGITNVPVKNFFVVSGSNGVEGVG